jgi:hypothetical protein
MSELSCARMHELAPELALDVLTGYERATAQSHLGMCEQCRKHVASLTQIGDRMLTLVPGVEPPVGFEDRVLVSMGFPGRKAPPSARRRWWPITVAAAAVIAVLFGVGGWVVGNLTAPDRTSSVADNHPALRFAPLRSSTDEHQVGQVFTYGGSPWWVYMSVTNAGASTVWCQLLQQDGKVVDIGSFQLSGGKGSWGQQVSMDPSTIAGARLVTDEGAVLATAMFAPPTAYSSTKGPK